MQLSSYVPALRWVPSYRRRDAAPDLVAGAALWALVVPQSLAYASLAGVPVEHGLYAMVPAMLLYAVFARSSRTVVGVSAATAALSPLVVTSVADVDDVTTMAAYASAVAMCVGVVYLALGVFRMGWVANFLSAPVVAGFITGFGITLAIGQVPKMLGFSTDAEGALREIWAIVSELDETHAATLAVSAASLLVLFGLPKIAPRVPGALVVVVLGIVATALFDLGDRGVSLVGDFPAGLPDLGLPDIPASDVLPLLVASVSIAIVGVSELLGAAEAVAHRHKERLDSNQEFLANGIANLGSGLAGGVVVNGSLSKTAANEAAGARTQVSGVTAAVLGLLTLLFLTELFADLPNAVLGAVVFKAATGLIEIEPIRRAFRVQRMDAIAAVGALVGTLVSDILVGMIIGVVLSLALLIHRASRPGLRVLGRVDGGADEYRRVDLHPEAVTTPGVVVTRVDGSLFFASSAPLLEALRDLVAREQPQAIVVDMESVSFVDTTAADALREFAAELDDAGIDLQVARLHDEVREVLERAGPTGFERADRLHPSIGAAVVAATARPRTDGTDAPS